MLRLLTAAAALIAFAGESQAADLSATLPTKAPPEAAAYDWSGFYAGAHLGYAGGTSNFSGPAGIAESLDLFQPYNAFTNTGSYFAGLQGGYNYMLPNRLVVGAEVDASFPSFPNLAGISIGGLTAFNSPFGVETYSETVLMSGTVRGRIGYAPGNWLIYATGGFAWSYDQLTLTNDTNGATDAPFLWRLGWTAGAGIEAPVMPHWTARLEYLFTDYGNESVLFANNGQRFTSDFAQQELRAGLDYHFGGDQTAADATAPATPDPDNVNLHGQTTFTWQGYPSFRSLYVGPNSLPGSGEGRETTDATLYAGLRLWQGAELWINPEIDQGFGLADTHGVAGFTSAEAYKVGADYPYARQHRVFIRQTIDLGGETEKVDADINQFAGAQTANRLVLTLGKFSVVDIFDTNKYANNPKNDFLNWSLVNAGTFDYPADAWAYTLGGAAEWYQGNWTLRGGAFDLSATPTGGTSPDGVNLDPTFDQFSLVGEVERRYELFGEPGALKVTGFLNRGRAAPFADAIALAQQPGPYFGNVTAALSAARVYDSRPGVSLNLQQQISQDFGVFARAGWADGQIEPWDFTDIDRTVSAGASLTGRQWGRPDDTVGVAGVVNGISKIQEEYLNDGGLGILVGDGTLPHPGPEQIIETYYNYALSASTHLTADYQFVVNPGYNEDRGPVNVFSTRVHWQF